MTMCDRLLRQLAERGLRVEAGGEPGQLRLVGRTSEATPAVMDALRQFKPELLVRFKKVEIVHAEPDLPPEPVAATEECRVCGRSVDAEGREVLRGVNPLCTQGGSQAATDGNGVYHPATERCPWKESP